MISQVKNPEEMIGKDSSVMNGEFEMISMANIKNEGNSFIICLEKDLLINCEIR